MMPRFAAVLSLVLLVQCLVVTASTPHPACEAMASYQAPYVASTYNITKHMGFYYELAFRDLYPGSPTCDCQATTKVPGSPGTYHEDFSFECYTLPFSSLISLTTTTPGQVAVYNQTMVKSNPNPPLPGLNKVVFNTATVAFKEVPGQQQYEWVIEFTCGNSEEWILDHMFPGGFVGINLYSRTGPLSPLNLAEMEAAVKDLGLGWAMDSWGWGYHHVPAKNCTYHP